MKLRRHTHTHREGNDAEDITSARVPSKTFGVRFASQPRWCTIYVCVCVRAHSLARPLVLGLHTLGTSSTCYMARIRYDSNMT